MRESKEPSHSFARHLEDSFYHAFDRMILPHVTNAQDMAIVHNLAGVDPILIRNHRHLKGRAKFLTAAQSRDYVRRFARCVCWDCVSPNHNRRGARYDTIGCSSMSEFQRLQAYHMMTTMCHPIRATAEENVRRWFTMPEEIGKQYPVLNFRGQPVHSGEHKAIFDRRSWGESSAVYVMHRCGV